MAKFTGKTALRQVWPVLAALLALAFAWSMQQGVFAETPEEMYKAALKSYAAKDYPKAQELLQKLQQDHPQFAQSADVALKLVDCYRRTIPNTPDAENLWDTGIEVLDGLIARQATTDLDRARAARLAANFVFEWPHWGYKTNAKFARGSHRGDGEYKETFIEDREQALEYIRQSRNRYEKLLAADRAPEQKNQAAAALTALEAETIEMYIDLARIAAWENANLHQTPPHAPKDKALPAKIEWQDTLSDKGLWTYAAQRIMELDRTPARESALRAQYLHAIFLKRYYGLVNGGNIETLNKLPDAENPYKVLMQAYLSAPKPEALEAGAPREQDLGAECLYAAGMLMQDLQQYNRAIEHFKTLIAERPQARWKIAAEAAIGSIEQPQLNVAGSQGSQTLQDIDDTGKLTPRKISIGLNVRNVAEVKFTATPVDMVEAVSKAGINYWQLFNLHYEQNRRNQKDTILDFKSGEPIVFTRPVEHPEDHVARTVQFEMPFEKTGVWVVEAEIKDCKVRQVVVASDLLMLFRLNAEKPMIYVADAVTGKPAVDAEVTFYEQWWTNRQQQKELASVKVGKDGLVDLPKDAQPNGRSIMLVATRRDPETKAIRSCAYTQPQWFGSQNWNPGQMNKVFSVTDRPVYRPGQEVKFKHTVRVMQNEEYTNPGVGTRVHVQIHDPKGAQMYEQVLTTNVFGTVFGEFKLSETAVLGQYNVQVWLDNQQWGTQMNGGQVFRVEEYKKPEYEVNVKSDVEQMKLGGVVHATISAKYYYGAPVTQATVQYKVQRKKYSFTWSPGGEWSWLYGRYYGCCWYWPYWWYEQPVEDLELIQEGEVPIGPDGTVKIDIDTAETAQKFPEMDHEFTISATVRDQSRRNIDGEGSVIVTRAPYYAVLSSEYGYWWWGDGNRNVSVRVATQKPDGTAVPSKGTVEVFRTQWNWQTNQEKREAIESKEFSVDATGSGLFTFAAPEPGQYEVVYTSKSDWGADVKGSTRVWTYGQGFDGKKYKTQNLELILDKRSYQPGETAKVMINGGYPGATVLLFNEAWYSVRSQQILTLDGKTTVVEIPIGKEDVPNFFLTAVTVRNGQIIQETREICVPPAKEFLDVTVTADKSSYKPGEMMNLDISAKDQTGKPVAAEFDISVFDKSILYIQPEYGTDIRTWYHGQRRQRWNNLMTSQMQLGWPAQWTSFNRRGHYLNYPPAWQGNWGTVGEFAGGLYLEVENGEMLDDQLGAVTAPGMAGNRWGGRFYGREKMGMAMADGAPMPTMAPAAPAAAMAMEAAGGAPPAEDRADANAVPQDATQAQPVFAEAVVRSNFADAAFWRPSVVTDLEGKAKLQVPMPENLTGWVVNSHAISDKTQVAKARIEVVTAKNLLVRLQTPRFAVQHDEIVISANVMNYLTAAKQAKVTLATAGGCAEVAGAAEQTVTIAANGEARVDWRLRVTRPGKVELVATALTDEESDAMKLEFPTVVYGLPIVLTQTKTVPYSEGDVKIDMAIPLPGKYDPAQSRLEVSYTPTLAGGMLEAMPYLVSYPYGCTEQTMSRYLPTVVVSNTMAKTGIDLEAVRKAGKRPSPDQMGRFGHAYPYYYESPVFDKDEVTKMVKAGLDRLYSFQHGDGGWGWWKDDSSSPYMTAYVTYGLQIAKASGQPVDQNAIDAGCRFLEGTIAGMDFAKTVEGYDYQVRGPEGLAFMAVALAEAGKVNDKVADYLVTHQDKMSDYGRALTVCALAQWKKTGAAKKALEGLLTHVEVSKEFDTASLIDKRPDNYPYWYWYNNNIEANAWTLRALMAVQPESELGPKMVRWLLAQRRGYRWYSTRDTAMCLYAMTDYLEKSKEGNCDYELSIDHAGVKKTVAVSAANLFNFDCRYVLEGEDVLAGKPGPDGKSSVEVSMQRKGRGAVYATMALEVYTQDEHIPAGGNQMSVQRTYYKLTPKTVTKKTRNAQGEVVEMPMLEYERSELKTGDAVNSGDRIEVELVLTTPFEYEYIAVEDWKPAGCEPVDRTSDAQDGVNAWWTHRELRDQKVTFFIGWLNRGKATLTYQLRAETPGSFHCLPTQAYLMYTPEIRANAASFLMPINDTPVVK